MGFENGSIRVWRASGAIGGDVDITPARHHKAAVSSLRVARRTVEATPPTSQPVNANDGWPRGVEEKKEEKAAVPKTLTAKKRGKGKPPVPHRPGGSSAASTTRKRRMKLVSGAASVVTDNSDVSATGTGGNSRSVVLPGMVPVHHRDKLVSVSTDGVIAVWDLHTMELLHTETHPAHNGALDIMLPCDGRSAESNSVAGIVLYAQVCRTRASMSPLTPAARYSAW